MNKGLRICIALKAANKRCFYLEETLIEPAQKAGNNVFIHFPKIRISELFQIRKAWNRLSNNFHHTAIGIH